ncbi:hypothetical protein G6011_07356 [Alternaria panax]|nr:hypothetical protein G6011_07356 [Alternaria panax]
MRNTLLLLVNTTRVFSPPTTNTSKTICNHHQEPSSSYASSEQIPTAKMPQAQPELKKYLEKRVLVQLNGSRKVMGILRGYDVYLNIVLDEALEEKAGGEKVRIGMVVIRGNAVVMLEALDRINQDVPKIGR